MVSIPIVFVIIQSFSNRDLLVALSYHLISLSAVAINAIIRNQLASISSLMVDPPGLSKPVIIYGCIFGDYDEPPTVETPLSNCEYYLITDSQNLGEKFGCWNIIYRPQVMGCPKRSSSIYKCDPSVLFPGRKVLWVDCNLTPTKYFTYSTVLELTAAGSLVLGIHPDRSSGLDELNHCTRLGYIDISRARNYSDFLFASGWNSSDGWLSHTSVMYRDLSDSSVVAGGKMWALLCSFGPIRDQVTVSVAFEQAGCKATLINNYSEWLQKNFVRHKHNDNRKAVGYGSYGK